jgi:hypothetical protein
MYQFDPNNPFGLPTFNPALGVPSGGAALPSFDPNQLAMLETGSRPIMGGTAPIAPVDKIPGQTPMAFRTKDLGVLLLALLAGNQGGDVLKGYLGVKQNKANQDTQVNQAEWQQRQETTKENAKLANEKAIRDAQFKNNLDVAGLRTASAENIATGRNETTLAKAEPLGEKLKAEAGFISGPKTDLTKAQAGNVNANAAFTAGPKTDKTKAETGLIGSKQNTENATRAGKVNKLANDNAYRAMLTKWYPKEKASAIALHEAQAKAAITRADAAMVNANANTIRANNPRSGGASASGQRQLPATYIENLRKGKSAAYDDVARNTWIEKEFRAKVDAAPNNENAPDWEGTADFAHAQIVKMQHKAKGYEAQLKDIEKRQSQLSGPIPFDPITQGGIIAAPQVSVTSKRVRKPSKKTSDQTLGYVPGKPWSP